ncbi:MAG: hypothetical protein FWD92_06980 [Methanomassiliicoccaceae archaeon]|nr:hypothetical protein [Methanomassiliicoccaceae archaeon]
MICGCKRKTEETAKAAAGVAMAVNKINMGSYDLSDPMGRHDAVNAVNGVIA